MKRLYLSGECPVSILGTNLAGNTGKVPAVYTVADKSVLTSRSFLLGQQPCCAGNPLKPGFLSEPCYHLVYLELAACRLITLPADFSRMVPNVRVLNLNYNFIEDPRPLEGLTRLRKLTIIGSRIKGAKQLVRMVRGMKDIEMIDFR